MCFSGETKDEFKGREKQCFLFALWIFVVLSLMNMCVYVCRFADTEVRNVAVGWIEKSSDDELADYLPQLVQVKLKIDTQIS